MDRLTFKQEQTEERGSIEIVTQVRDIDGKPTGKTKSYTSDSPFKIWQFYMRNKGKPKKKREKNLPAGQEANQILNEAATYAEKKQIEREEKQQQHGE